jgi:hypothetical protein
MRAGQHEIMSWLLFIDESGHVVSLTSRDSGR